MNYQIMHVLVIKLTETQSFARQLTIGAEFRVEINGIACE